MEPSDMTAPATAHLDTDTSKGTTTGLVRRWCIGAAERLGSLTLPQLTAIIWISSIVMCLMLLGSSRDTIRGTMNIVENWGAVERVALWQDWLEPVLPRYQLPTGVIAWGFRLAMLAGFVAQVAAFIVVMKSDKPSLLKWMIGPLGAHIIQLFLMVPSNSDVFFYEAVGDFAANGINPFVSELMDHPDHPLIPFNFWIDIGTVYGPHWVNYNRIVMSFVGPDPIAATLVQKALAGIFAIGLGLFIYWFARKLSGGNAKLAVAAAVLVLWQPNMILESTGQVHNDPHTVLIATVGLAVVVLGGLAALRAGIVLVAVSVMIKFITLPLFGVLGILRLVDRKKPDGWTKRIFGNWILDGIAIAAVVLGAFLPYWEGPETVHEMLAEPDRLYTHPLWRGIQSLLGVLFPDSVSGGWTAFTRPILQFLTIFGSIAIVTWLGYRLWRDPNLSEDSREDPLSEDGLPWWTRHLLYAWLFVFLLLSFVPVNSHPWYWVWPVPAVAQVMAFELRRNKAWTPSSMPTWFWVYVWGNALITLAYHTRIARY
jgi:hypothetical protein